MSEAYRLWTHGAAVIAEYTKEYTGTNNGLYLRRTGWGSQVRQKRGTSNWFHLAIPSPTTLENRKSYHYHAFLRAKVNTDAIIDRVHVREAQGPGSHCPVIYDSGAITITGQNKDFDYNLPDNECTGPIVLCVHVKFDGNHGEVIFTGAGARFEEK